MWLGDVNKFSELKQLHLNLFDVWTWWEIKKLYENILPLRNQLELLEL